MKKIPTKKLILYLLSFCFACLVTFLMNHSSFSELAVRLSTFKGLFWSLILFAGFYYVPVYSFGMWQNNRKIQRLIEVNHIPEEALPELTGIAKKYFVLGAGNKLTVVTENAQKIVIEKLEKKYN